MCFTGSYKATDEGAQHTFMKSVLLSMTALRNVLICLSGLLWKQLVIYLLKEEKRDLIFSPAVRATIE